MSGVHRTIDRETAQGLLDIIHGDKGSEFIDGFSDATHWLLDPDDDSPELMAKYQNPPDGLEGCEGCAGDVVVENDCPACRYQWGFTNGASK